MSTTKTKDLFAVSWPRPRRWLFQAVIVFGAVWAVGAMCFGWSDRPQDITAGTIAARRFWVALTHTFVVALLVWHFRRGLFCSDWSIVRVTAAGVRDRRLGNMLIPWRDVTAIRPWTYAGSAMVGADAVVLEMPEAAMDRLRFGWMARSKIGRIRTAGVIGIPIDARNFARADFGGDARELLDACRSFHAAAKDNSITGNATVQEEVDIAACRSLPRLFQEVRAWRKSCQ